MEKLTGRALHTSHLVEKKDGGRRGRAGKGNNSELGRGESAKHENHGEPIKFPRAHFIGS